jgi:NADH dehydrogenase
MTNTDLVTGAFSYTGAEIARQLLTAGRGVRTLTYHPDRDHPLREQVPATRYRFDDPVALAASLEGVDTLYNTYWVRFDRGQTTFANALANSRLLFHAARRAGVSRIVHVSISNPSVESPLPYYRGKALVENALAEVGIPYAIVRPTWVFGGDRDVLANNIAWILRRMPVFPLPGTGAYEVQPVHVGDLARICIEAARGDSDTVRDAAGPETFRFDRLVATVRRALGARAPIVPVPALVMAAAARALGTVVVGDVVLTPDEIRGLTASLLVSHHPPLGTIRFSDWVADAADAVGRDYANELERHFHRPAVAT